MEVTFISSVLSLHRIHRTQNQNYENKIKFQIPCKMFLMTLP
jgi:hypothetical protein